MGQSRGMRAHVARGVMAAMLVMATAVPVAAAPPPVAQKYTQAYVMENIAIGKTTVAQVRDRFGEPTDVEGGVRNGNAVNNWTYLREDDGTRGAMQRTRSAFSRVRNYLPQAAGSAATDASIQGYKVQGHARDVEELTEGKETMRMLFIEFGRNGVVENYRLD